LAEKKKQPLGSLTDFPPEFLVTVLGGKIHQKFPKKKPMKFTVPRNSFANENPVYFECQRDGGFKCCVVFSPRKLGKIPILTNSFQHGLKPPTVDGRNLAPVEEKVAYPNFYNTRFYISQVVSRISSIKRIP